MLRRTHKFNKISENQTDHTLKVGKISENQTDHKNKTDRIIFKNVKKEDMDMFLSFIVPLEVILSINNIYQESSIFHTSSINDYLQSIIQSKDTLIDTDHKKLVGDAKILSEDIIQHIETVVNLHKQIINNRQQTINCEELVKWLINYKNLLKKSKTYKERLHIFGEKYRELLNDNLDTAYDKIIHGSFKVVEQYIRNDSLKYVQDDDINAIIKNLSQLLEFSRTYYEIQAISQSPILLFSKILMIYVHKGFLSLLFKNPPSIIKDVIKLHTKNITKSEVLNIASKAVNFITESIKHLQYTEIDQPIRDQIKATLDCYKNIKRIYQTHYYSDRNDVIYNKLTQTIEYYSSILEHSKYHDIKRVSCVSDLYTPYIFVLQNSEIDLSEMSEEEYKQRTLIEMMEKERKLSSDDNSTEEERSRRINASSDSSEEEYQSSKKIKIKTKGIPYSESTSSSQKEENVNPLSFTDSRNKKTYTVCIPASIQNEIENAGFDNLNRKLEKAIQKGFTDGSLGSEGIKVVKNKDKKILEKDEYILYKVKVLGSNQNGETKIGDMRLLCISKKGDTNFYAVALTDHGGVVEYCGEVMQLKKNLKSEYNKFKTEYDEQQSAEKEEGRSEYFTDFLKSQKVTRKLSFEEEETKSNTSF